MRVIASLLILLGPLPAAADALPPAPENCPPGLDGQTSHRGPICAPIRCTSDADCGEGAACADAAFCQREREVPNPRMGGTMTRTDTGPWCLEVGCPEVAATGDEGPPPWECRRWRWCEPTAPTPAWNPETHAWTGEPHVAQPAPEPEPEAEAEEEDDPQPAAEPPEEDSGGCAVGVDGTGSSAWLAATAAALIRARRRGGRRTRARGR